MSELLVSSVAVVSELLVFLCGVGPAVFLFTPVVVVDFDLLRPLLLVFLYVVFYHFGLFSAFFLNCFAFFVLFLSLVTFFLSLES